MKIYRGSFVKDNGKVRTMFFAKLKDIEDAKPGFLNAKTTGTGTSPTQETYKELVWELLVVRGNLSGEGQFRVFNYNTVQGEISASEFDENNLV